MYLYSKKIKCVDCGNNYRGKKQRSVRVYICSGYNTGKSDCERFAIKEDDIVDTVERHRKIVGKESEVLLIEVQNGERGYKIKYNDGTHDSVVSETHLKY